MMMMMMMLLLIKENRFVAKNVCFFSLSCEEKFVVLLPRNIHKNSLIKAPSLSLSSKKKKKHTARSSTTTK